MRVKFFFPLNPLYNEWMSFFSLFGVGGKCEVYGGTKQKIKDFNGCYWPKKKNPERGNKFSEVFEELFLLREGEEFLLLNDNSTQ